MKRTFCILLVAFSFSYGCSNISPDAVELKVDFSWEGVVPCAMGGNPEIKISGIPDGTKTIVASLHENRFLHGKQSFTYDGSGIIKKSVLDEFEGPCPRAFDAGQYKYKIQAVDENGVFIGIGSKERHYPEEK